MIKNNKKNSGMHGVLACKMPGADGYGYLSLMVENAKAFANEHSEVI